MCGVAGILVAEGAAPVEFEELRAMIAMVGHRGPDGYGLYRDDRAGLAHARLSIIDLEGGFQPLHNEDGTIWLSFNGEIFNYIELRAQLRAQGHTFVTNGDSEVIVHLYEQYGDEAWAKLNGQFAFALWDSRRRRLRLGRDRLGILPLHYARVGSRVLFASEVKSILATGDVTPAVDPVGLAEVFTRWSATAPRTVFDSVRSVRPGTVVSIDAELRETEHRYWEADLAERADAAALSPDGAAEQLGHLLEEAVQLRLRADVPVGAYLSGGLDSSVIGALVRSADTSALETFAVRFEDPRFDETSEQRQVAGLLGTRHHEIVCGSRELQQSLADVVWHGETPLLRTAPVPLFLLSGLVRDAGMKVVLTGEGADEIQAGYSIFKEDRVRRFWARDPESSMRPALFARLHPEVSGGDARSSELWSRYFARGLTDTDDDYYSHRIRWENTAWCLRVLSPALLDAVPADARTGPDVELPTGWNEWTPLARAQWLEITTFMSSYLLASQGDRVAMAHGVEVRYPFLDPNLVDFALGLPDRYKLNGLRDKVSLRRFAAQRLPRDVAWRPKQPYRAPMTVHAFGPDAPAEVDDLLSSDAIDRLGLANPMAARKLIDKARRRGGVMASEREEMALVGLLTLHVFASQYLTGFGSRVQARRRDLDRQQCRILVDRTTTSPSAPEAQKSSVSP